MGRHSRVLLTCSILLLAASGCAPEPAPDDGELQAGGLPATRTLARVAITSLPGASSNAGAVGKFVGQGFHPGSGRAPALSNSLLSSVPGTPAKPLFVGQSGTFDEVLVAVKGRSGHFVVPAGDSVVALDLVAAQSGVQGETTLFIATRRRGQISQVAKLTLFIDPRVFVAAGDLENHDDDGSNIADLFAPFLEGNQGDPPIAEQVLEGEDNNDLIAADGVKGLAGPAAEGHREVVWDGVPRPFLNRTDFPATFFNRQASDNAGVRGGIVFKATGGRGEEVNDALNGVAPEVDAPQGADDDGPPGGDFSNINPKFAKNLLSFTQSAQFATIGTTVTDITFTVAGTSQRATVNGLGIVFSSVDRLGSTSIEYFDENGRRIIKIFAPTQSKGPFPFLGPVVADKFPYSFVGFNDRSKRIARVRVTAGDIAVDKASNDLVNGKDVVAFDDVYYAEPRP
jgi:hypothetical protein